MRLEDHVPFALPKEEDRSLIRGFRYRFQVICWDIEVAEFGPSAGRLVRFFMGRMLIATNRVDECRAITELFGGGER